MISVELNKLSVDQLVASFRDLAIAQSQAELYDQNAKYNRLYRQIIAIKDELKAREGDQRRALVSLFAHPNAQVRLTAAQWALAVVPDAAKEALQKISDNKEYPQAADARLTLMMIDRGESTLL